MRKLRAENEGEAKAIIQEMLEIYLTKRKCKLHQGFFHFVLKKMPQLRESVVEKCLSLEGSVTLRPAQARVLQKFKQLLLKKQSVKEEPTE
jgi:hypothetical protein